MDLAFPLLLLFALLAAGMPVAFALATAGMVGLYLTIGIDGMTAVLGSVPHTATSSLILTTVPMFLLMAEFLSESQLVSRVFHAASLWTSRLPGGLAISTVLANAGMGALSGSSTASAATMASVCVPEMRKYGYSAKLSLGAVAASGTLAAMIPPSIAMIVYGITTETSIGDLFLAGVVPGLLSALAYVLVVVVWVSRNRDIAPAGERHSYRDRLSSLITLWPLVVLVVTVLYCLYTGFMTATEAGAIGAFGALLVGVFAGGLRWSGACSAIARTVKTTAMVFAIVVGATIFARYLAVTRVTYDLSEYLESAAVSPTIVVVLVVTMYLVLGMFLDTLAMLLLTLPVVFPLVTDLGYDPVWLGIIIIKTAEIGLASPPVGMNVFVTVGAVRGANLMDAFAGASRFIVADLVLLVVLIALPGISLWLPGSS